MAKEDKKPKDSEERKESRKSQDERNLSLRNAFGRFFDDDFWIEPFDVWQSPRRLMSRWSKELFPRIDIKENDKEVTVVADIPGVDPDEVQLEVKDNRMVIYGQTMKEAKEDMNERTYRYERAYGHFRREFVLPVRVKEDEVKAVCKNGILTITLPKVEEEKPNKIKIEKG